MGFDVYRYEAGEDTLDSLHEQYAQDDQMSEVMLGEVNGVKVLVYRVDETLVGAALSGVPSICTRFCSAIRPPTNTRRSEI